MSARDDAIRAGVLAAVEDDNRRAMRGKAPDITIAASAAVDAAIPVLLAPLRAVIDRALADVDAGHRNDAIAGLISADVILREIEGGESR